MSKNGKVDRNALPVPVQDARAKGADDGEGDESPTERAVAEIWTRLLPGKIIDRKRSFFEQGGHSLLAMQLVSRILEVFQIALPLAALFENPTIASLALVIEEKLTEEFENTDGDRSSPEGETP